MTGSDWLQDWPMPACIFCQIVAGESPASIFFEDDVVLGLMTIGPVNPGHAMVIPKKNSAYLAEMDEATGRRLWTVAQRTAAAIRASGIRCEGVNLFLADGEAAFEEVFHVHLLVFPRIHGDPFKIEVDWDDEALAVWAGRGLSHARTRPPK